MQTVSSAPPPAPRASEAPDMPYAYSQPSGGYGQSSGLGYENPSYGGGGTPPGRWIIIGGALLLAVCCAFACGLVFGFELIPDLLGMGGAAATTPVRPTIAPTPSSFLPLLHLLIG